jgi:hypothetical protein
MFHFDYTELSLGAKFGTCQEVQKLRLYKNRLV